MKSKRIDDCAFCSCFCVFHDGMHMRESGAHRAQNWQTHTPPPHTDKRTQPTQPHTAVKGWLVDLWSRTGSSIRPAPKKLTWQNARKIPYSRFFQCRSIRCIILYIQNVLFLSNTDSEVLTTVVNTNFAIVSRKLPSGCSPTYSSEFGEVFRNYINPCECLLLGFSLGW